MPTPARREAPRNDFEPDREGELPVNPPKGSTLNVVPDSKADAGPEVLQPAGWPMPKGYANGMAADGRLVVTGGVIGWDAAGHLPEGFLAQVKQTLANIAAILAA